jgi:excisionase family DNA binding protein
MDPLLTRSQVATILRVNVRTVDRYIKDGLLVAVQPDRANLTRIRYQDLEAFLANRPKAQTRTPILSL